MEYVYIDESGDCGKGKASTQFLIIAGIYTRHPRKLEKVTKKVWRAKPHMHQHHELHAHKADDATKKKLLTQLAKLDITIKVHVVKKTKARTDYHKLYYRLLAEQIIDDPTRVVSIDKKDTNTKRQKTLKSLRLEQVFNNVEFEDSKVVKQLQAADFVCWAIFNKCESGDGSYYEIIKSKIEGIESPLL